MSQMFFSPKKTVEKAPFQISLVQDATLIMAIAQRALVVFSSETKLEAEHGCATEPAILIHMGKE